MKRLVLVSADLVKTGGMDRANYALASYLAEQGRDVHLVAFRVGDGLLKRPNVFHHRVPKPLGSDLLGHPVMDGFGRFWAGRLGKGAGQRVVVNGGNCRWGDVNWLHHLNILDPPRTGGGLGFRIRRHLAYRRYIREERAALGMARLIITTCERNKRDVVEWLGLPAERIRTAYYGIDPTVFRPALDAERAALRERLGWPVDRPHFAFVGALGDRRKGFDTLFEAWRSLCGDSSWDADLVVVGTGSELPAWKQRAHEAGIASRIRFLGFRRDVPDLIRASDAHVLPSRYEGYSLVTQEALACGLPAFITRTAGIAERYPAALEDCLIPDPDDSADLVSRLKRWPAWGGSTRAALGALSEQIRATTWDDMAARVAALVEGSE